MRSRRMVGASPARFHDDRRGSPSRSFNRPHGLLLHRKARAMSCSRAVCDDVSAHRRVVKRLINIPVETIEVSADGNCFREHEAYDLWKTGDTTRGPPYVVDAHHIGWRLSPNSLALARCEHGAFNLQPVTMELLVSEKFR